MLPCQYYCLYGTSVGIPYKLKFDMELKISNLANAYKIAINVTIFFVSVSNILTDQGQSRSKVVSSLSSII